MSLDRMEVGRHRERWREGERSARGERRERREREERRRAVGVQEESARERGRLASQFPAARYIYEAHKVASTTAYIAA